MLYYLTSKEKGLNKTLYRNEKPGRGLWTFIVSLSKSIQEAEGTQELVEEALDDHELVQELLDELATSRMNDAAWSEKLEVLAEHVEDHVEEEESDIFDVALQLFSAEQAAELAQRWQIAKQEQMARHAK